MHEKKNMECPALTLSIHANGMQASITFSILGVLAAVTVAGAAKYATNTILPMMQRIVESPIGKCLLHGDKKGSAAPTSKCNGALPKVENHLHGDDVVGAPTFGDAREVETRLHGGNTGDAPTLEHTARVVRMLQVETVGELSINPTTRGHHQRATRDSSCQGVSNYHRELQNLQSHQEVVEFIRQGGRFWRQ